MNFALKQPLIPYKRWHKTRVHTAVIFFVKHTVTSMQIDGKTKMYAQDSAKTKSSMRTLPLVGSFAEYFVAQEVNKKVCCNCYN